MGLPGVSDDFETDKGWLAAGDAIAGTFVRQNPYGVTAPGAGAVQPENDATPDPGQICWVTANPVVGPGFNPASGDVDRGTVYIQSPVFDGVGEGALILRSARWFHRSGLGPLDQATYRAQVSTDGGANWTDVETLDTNASAWVRRETDLAVLVEPASTMRLRFSAFELVRTPGDPLVELLVDDVQVVRQSIVCDPFVAPDAKRPNPVGGSLRAERAGPDVRLTWTPPPVDGDHDPARFFPVYRSVSPASGFAQRGDPSAPAWRDA